ncbi:MAG TPA: hypothetical protein VNZ67_05485, partial [bacterium]|nr:hypothetical protein [bacterium]
MKFKAISMVFCLLGLSLAAPMALKADGPTWLLDVHGDFTGVQTPAAAQGGSQSGDGLAIQWLPAPNLSLDLGADIDTFSKNGQTGSTYPFVSLGGHLLFPVGRITTLWLQGSAGRGTDSNALIGNWQAKLGAGVRLDLASYLGVNIGARYFYTTPSDAPIQALGATLGIVVPLGQPFAGWAKPVAEEKMTPAPVNTTSPSSAPSSTPTAKPKTHKHK